MAMTLPLCCPGLSFGGPHPRTLVYRRGCLFDQVLQAWSRWDINPETMRAASLAFRHGSRTPRDWRRALLGRCLTSLRAPWARSVVINCLTSKTVRCPAVHLNVWMETLPTACAAINLLKTRAERQSRTTIYFTYHHHSTISLVLSRLILSTTFHISS